MLLSHGWSIQGCLIVTTPSVCGLKASLATSWAFLKNKVRIAIRRDKRWKGSQPEAQRAALDSWEDGDWKWRPGRSVMQEKMRASGRGRCCAADLKCILMLPMSNVPSSACGRIGGDRSLGGCKGDRKMPASSLSCFPCPDMRWDVLSPCAPAIMCQHRSKAAGLIHHEVQRCELKQTSPLYGLILFIFAAVTES